jgi:hypothetical protein
VQFGRSRGSIAFRTGECGDSEQAVRLYQELLPDLARTLGADHPHVLDTRQAMAVLQEDNF